MRDLFIELEWSDLVKEKKSEFEKFLSTILKNQ